jgi:hypothetical protein
VKRGGSWNNNANNCTVSNRNNNNATNSNNNIGFRCVSIFASESALYARLIIEGKIQISILLPVTGQRVKWLHGLVALSNSREADYCQHHSSPIEIREEGKRQLNITSGVIPNQQLSLSLESTRDCVLRFDFINSEALVECADVRVVVVG